MVYPAHTLFCIRTYTLREATLTIDGVGGTSRYHERHPEPTQRYSSQSHLFFLSSRSTHLRPSPIHIPCHQITLHKPKNLPSTRTNPHRNRFNDNANPQRLVIREISTTFVLSSLEPRTCNHNPHRTESSLNVQQARDIIQRKAMLHTITLNKRNV
ncbi:hypothetical protein CC2G_007504 [Coprinopsis cinerea AmutBmut pab1-1]|nr:hypothetical protein CC2G_007504 [Coprinopsis cinerea AmutBmut pab1-1]